MARINVDDDVESRDEYKKLRKLLGGDDDRAMGMLIRFWRLAQKHWAEGDLVPMDAMEFGDLQPIMESRWGIQRESGVYAVGAEERFAWYRNQVAAASAGGRARAAAPRDEHGRYLPKASDGPAGGQPGASPEPALASSPAPVPAPVKKEGRIFVDALSTTWKETLKHRGTDRKLFPFEEDDIFRAIKKYGAEAADQALYGFRFEESFTGFNAKNHLKLSRVFDAEKIQQWINTAAANRPKPRELVEVEI